MKTVPADEFAVGIYATEDSLSSVELFADGTCNLYQAFLSSIPHGTWSLNQDVLTLTFFENTTYTFLTDGSTLIYQGSEPASKIIEKNTVFSYSGPPTRQSSLDNSSSVSETAEFPSITFFDGTEAAEFPSMTFFDGTEAAGKTYVFTETYTMMIPKDADEISRLSAPTLNLDPENSYFSFSYDLLSSYWPTGPYVIEDNVLTATTYDGRYQYVFSIIDDSTLQFCQEESSSVKLIDERLGVSITDGATFKKVLFPQVIPE